MLIPILAFATFVVLIAASYPVAQRAQDLVPEMHSVSTEARTNR